MPLKAILLGSLGTLADTSALQRRACNAAFAEAGLDWDWSAEAFRRLAPLPAVEQIARHARARGEIVDARALDRRRADILRGLLSALTVPPRQGLVGLVRAARDGGLRLGLVTTAAPESVDSMLAMSGLDRAAFEFVGDATMAPPKPAPGIYLAALAALDVEPRQALAIEETPEHAAAAEAAGIACVSFPGVARIGDPSPLSYLVAAREARQPEGRMVRRA